jgi:hypothetical protein
VLFDYLFDDHQAQACSLASLSRKKANEQIRQDLVGHPDSVVRHGHHDFAGSSPAFQSHQASRLRFRTGVDGVVDQVEQRPVDGRAV